MCAGMFLVLLDVTVVNVALPSIRGGMGASVAGAQWVVDGYAVAIASLLLAGGTLGDRIGHGRVVLAGLALFGVASIGCGVAPNTSVLVAARACQGVGAALLLPGSLAVITDTYPGRAEQARALGIWAGVSSLALPAGPLLGGLLVTVGGWRWVFLVNIPIVVAALIVIPRLVRLHPGHKDRRLDGAGLVTAVAALGGLVFAVIDSGRHGPSVQVVIAALVAVVAGAGFWRAQRRARFPMVPLELWRHPAFSGANLVALLMNLTINGIIFVTTLYLQDVRGLSALLAGCVLLPLFLPLVACAPLTGRLTARYGPRLPIVSGTVIAGAGAASMLLVGEDGSYAEWLPILLGLGVGAGLITAAVVAAAVRSVPAERSGLASGINNTARQTGTALGVAVFGAVAGNPLPAGEFVAGLHHLAVLGAGLWFVAMIISVVTLRN
jgi:MFS transporter, DHA2 family, methylenomycin A resistance protein